MKYKNTLNKGSVRCIIFKEGNTWYGVALEFNLVEEGQDPLEVMASLHQAVRGYVETARKFKMRPMALNQISDNEYEKLWDTLQSRALSKTGKDREAANVGGKEIYHFGYYTGAFSSASAV